MTILPQKFDGNSRYLDSFFVQFEIACQINSWPEKQKHYWLIKCLNGQALLFSLIFFSIYQSYIVPFFSRLYITRKDMTHGVISIDSILLNSMRNGKHVNFRGRKMGITRPPP